MVYYHAFNCEHERPITIVTFGHCFSGTDSRSIISTDQMPDWHAMMVSLMWNVQAWRDWIQETMNKALSYNKDPKVSAGKTKSTLN